MAAQDASQQLSDAQLGLCGATACARTGHAGSVSRSECAALLIVSKMSVQKAKKEHKEMKTRRKSKARLHKMTADELAALNQAAADEVQIQHCPEASKTVMCETH